MHILIIRFSSLGDIVLQSSFISWLKFIKPDCEISFLTSTSFKEVLQRHKDLDNLYVYDKKKGFKELAHLRENVQKIRAHKEIDFIVDLHGTTRSTLLRFVNPEIPSISIDKRRIERHFLIHAGLKLMNKTLSIHSRNIYDFLGLFTTDRNLKDYQSWIRQSYRIKDLEYSTPLYPTEIERSKTIVLAPVASFSPKRWRIENYKELVLKILSDKDLTGYKLINLAGAEDHFCDNLNTINHERFTNLQGKTTLNESIDIISKSEIMIGNDSGLGHIAESFGVPVISIFGPTHETLGFRPHLKKSKVISLKMWCRPCSGTGKSKCFRKKQYCLENISVTMVFDELKRSLV